MPKKSIPGSKIVLTIFGIFFLIVGIIGLLFPLLPTTPFILVAAWCFSHSSPRLHRFLMENKIFGPIIKNWIKYRAIGRRAKISATPFIVLFFGYSLIFTATHLALKFLLALIGIGLLVFIWSRPEGPHH